jgi:hypothetical protein
LFLYKSGCYRGTRFIRKLKKPQLQCDPEFDPLSNLETLTLALFGITPKALLLGIGCTTYMQFAGPANQAYKAFGDMLRLPAPSILDQRLVDSCKQMCIEERLNDVGRGSLLASSQTPREEWVDALQKLNATNDDDLLEVGCLYSLLRSNPSVCLLELNDTTNSVL